MEEREDRFAHLIKFCKPTASQEAKFLNCPLARESENFSEPNPNLLSSSPELTPSEPAGIIMVSPPDSAENSVGRNSPREDEPLFHTPPEEQNPDESSSDGAKTVDLGDRFDERKRVRCAEGEMNDELISKKTRVEDEDMYGETMAIDEIVKILDEIDENERVQDFTEVIDLDGTELVEDSVEKIRQSGFRDGNENEAQKIREDKVAEKSSHELLGSKQAVSNGRVVIGENRRVGGSEEFSNLTKDERVCKDRCKDGGRRRGVNNVGEIEKSKYVSGDERGNFVAVGRRELPLSMKGKLKDSREEAEDTAQKGNEVLRDFLNAFNGVVEDANDGCGDNFFEIAKRRGLTFPRPRWWPPEDDK